MNSFSIIWKIAKANFFDQVRRDKFFLTLLAIVVILIGVVPPPTAHHSFITFGPYRMFYNSAWIGTFIAILTSLMLVLPGFYLLRGTIQKDKYLGLGEIYATTKLSRMMYLLGKYFSNVALLMLIGIVAAVVAMVLQLRYGEEPYIHILTLLKPFLLFTLPTIFIVAALSLFFDTVKGLSGLTGDILYGATIIGLLSLSLLPSTKAGTIFLSPGNDVIGISTVFTEIGESIKGRYPGYSGQIRVGLMMNDHVTITEPVRWEGEQFSLQLINARLIWIAGAWLVVGLAGLVFLRFDPAREPMRKPRLYIAGHTPREEELNVIFPVLQKYVTPMLSYQYWKRYRLVFRDEIKLFVRNTPWWWFVVVAVLDVACIASPFDLLREWMLPVAWIWPLVIWSKIGMRLSEHYRTRQIRSDAQRDALLLQVLWVIGVLVALSAGLGAGIRFILEGEWAPFTAWLITAAFIPSLAIVLSIWTNSAYVFEGTYVFLWLIGCVSKQPLLDFMGTLENSIVVQNPFLYIISTLALITFAAVGRQRLIER